MDQINNKLDFCIELGNVVGDDLPKVPKNPRPASWDIAKKQMAVNSKNWNNIFSPTFDYSTEIWYFLTYVYFIR